MPEQNQHSEIMQTLGKLEGLVIGITQRQDTANGRTSKIEAKQDIIEKRVDKWEGMIKMFNIIWGAVIAFGGLLVGAVSLFVAYYK